MCCMGMSDKEAKIMELTCTVSLPTELELQAEELPLGSTNGGWKQGRFSSGSPPIIWEGAAERRILKHLYITSIMLEQTWNLYVL